VGYNQAGEKIFVTIMQFHPWEALFQAIFLPIMLMILPMHYYVIVVQLVIMTISSVINHLDIEIYHIGKTYFYDEIDICGLLIKRVLYSATGIMMNLFII
jgi:hypothetical protein